MDFFSASLLAPLLVAGGALFLAYVLAGYPLLLGWLVRGHARKPRQAPFEPLVTVILCVHNGGRFLEQKLRSILELDYPSGKLDVVVVSDGSTDDTAEIARRFAAQGVVLLEQPRSGKPAGINSGMQRARGEIVVLTDVRQQLEPGSLRYLLENFADPEVGACSGELVIRDGATSEEVHTGLYWRYELWIRLRLSELDSIFGATGAYYAIRRELVVPLPADALLDDMYLPLAGFFRGYRLVVDPRARMFDYPTNIGSEFRRKVRTLAGNYQILAAYPQLLWPGANRLWIHFCSYKLARLFLPFALLLIAGSSWFLPDPWRVLLLGAQGVFYALGVADIWIPEGSPFKRLSSPIRTFLVMMAAAFCAVSILVLPGSWFWKPTQIQPGQAK